MSATPSTASAADQPHQQQRRSRGQSSRQNYKQIGQFTLTQETIGRGRFGRVYKGFYTNTKEPVAMKVVQTSEISITEVREMQRLRGHQNILKLLDQQQNEKYLVLVMEYCDGDLEKAMDQKKLVGNEGLCKKLFRQLLRGLAVINEKRMMHRDLKPANILLQGKDLENSVVKIGDLGLAKSQSESLAQARMNETTCGTPYFMAPERLDNKPYDFQAEMWAAGVILYQMFYGEKPYIANGVPELFRLTQVPPSYVMSPDANCDPPSEDLLSILSQLIVFKAEDRLTIQQALDHRWVREDSPTMVSGAGGIAGSSTPSASDGGSSSNVTTPVTNTEPAMRHVSIGTSPMRQAMPLPTVTGDPAMEAGGVKSASPPSASSSLTQPPSSSFGSRPGYVDPMKGMTVAKAATGASAPIAVARTSGGSAQLGKSPASVASPSQGNSFTDSPDPQSQSMQQPSQNSARLEATASCQPEDVSSFGSIASAKANQSVESAKTIITFADKETDPAKSAVLYAYAAEVVKDTPGDDPRRLFEHCGQMARAYLQSVPIGTQCRNPVDILISGAVRLGREAATEEQFDNKFCGPENEPIIDAYRRGQKVVEVVLTNERTTMSREHYDSVQQLEKRFSERIEELSK